jgi:hypothetical protein
MKLAWDETGTREYETGVDHGVLYIPDEAGEYTDGVAWNGLTTVTEAPTGADATAKYADNMKYLNLYSAEQLGLTIEALTYPDEFLPFDGVAKPSPGVFVGQQTRKGFGLCYRTIVGNDVDGNDHGYKLHLVYGATASPSQKAYGTVNDTPDAIAFSWTLATLPVSVTGLKPTSIVVVDSTDPDLDPAALAALELILYGDDAVDPRLPLPDEVIAMLGAGAPVVLAPLAAPAYNGGTHTITIPATAHVEYLVDDVVVPPGALVITEDTLVVARATPGWELAPGTDSDWFFDYV